MITEKEKLKQKLLSLSQVEVEELVSEWQAAVSKNHQDIIDALLTDGFEEVANIHDKYLTTDGRELMWVDGRAYALKLEIHNQRREEAFEAARQQNEEAETRSILGSEQLAAIVCPKCKEAVEYSVVCGKCAAGKAGYRHRYTCVCGVDFISKDRL
jgi:hypothetical protein